MSAPLAHYPVFEQRPTEEYVSAWQAYSDGTGYPERYENVSTTHPPKDAEVVLLSGEIRVPVLRREGQEWVPCPICSPTGNKFKVGRQAWFPQEKAVRFIGHRCAAKHFGEQYKIAEAQFARVGRMRHLISRWNEILPHTEAIQRYVEALRPAAQAAAVVRQMMDAEASGFAPWLHRELTRGLPGQIALMNDTGFKDAKGNAVLESYVLGVVAGVRFLGEEYQPDEHLEAASAILKGMERPLPTWSVDEQSEDAEREIELRAGEAFFLADYVLDAADQVDAARDFLAAENLALLERWSKNNQSPFRSLICRIEDGGLRIRSVSFVGTHYVNSIVGDGLFQALPNRPGHLFNLKSLGGLSRKGRLKMRGKQ